jgi:hypothetical protein
MAAFDPKMGKRIEMEWYEEVRVEKKFRYSEANKEKMNTVIRLQLNFNS